MPKPGISTNRFVVPSYCDPVMFFCSQIMTFSVFFVELHLPITSYFSHLERILQNPEATLNHQTDKVRLPPTRRIPPASPGLASDLLRKI